MLTFLVHLRRSRPLLSSGVMWLNLRLMAQHCSPGECWVVFSFTTRLYVLPFPHIANLITCLQTHTTLIERQARALNTLEAHLLTRTFIVGERITLADISIAAAVYCAVSLTVDAEARSKFVNTIRHLETIINQPKLKDIFGEIPYVEKIVQYVPPKKEPKPAPAPAAPKEKKEKPKQEEVDDEDDGNLVPEEPKAKNPLDLLPKSPFNLEDWKRAYSNKDTRGPGGALEWFYVKCFSMSPRLHILLTIVQTALTRKASQSGESISSTTKSSRSYSCPPTKSEVSLTVSKPRVNIFSALWVSLEKPTHPSSRVH